MPDGIVHRFALVVGNAAYPISPLRNPPNDATAMGRKLVALGFDVRTELNINAEKFRQAVAEFCRHVAEAGGQEAQTQAVLFYAGHGVQVDGENYLLPIDSQFTTKFELKQSAIGLDILLEAMGACARTSVVLLDCCRDNPLPRTADTRSLATSHGLANVRAPKGVYVAFATQPHFVALDGKGDNSPFTEAMLDHVDDPAKHVSEVLMDVRKDVYDKTAGQQIPWDHSALFEPFIFATADLSSLPPGTDQATRDRVWRDQEKAREESYWKIVQRSTDTDFIQSFVTQFPNSAYRAVALERIDKINNRAWLRVVIPLALLVAVATLYFMWIGSLYFRMQQLPDADIAGGDIEQENGLYGYETSLARCRFDCVTDFGARRCLAFSYDTAVNKCYPKYEAVFFTRPSIDGGNPTYSEFVPDRGLNPTETTFHLFWDRGLSGKTLPFDVVAKAPGATGAQYVPPEDDDKDSNPYWAVRGSECQRLCNSLPGVCMGFSYTRTTLHCELFGSVQGVTRDGLTQKQVYVPGTFSGCSDPTAPDCKATLDRRKPAAAAVK
jgi:uncharacterized caspase-like protein